MVDLPVISCDGCGVCCMHCGVCCMHIGWPPYLCGEAESLPASVRADLELTREISDRVAVSIGHDYFPCGWLDRSTGRCKHYEHRPEVCREFEVGGEDCHELRESGGIA